MKMEHRKEGNVTQMIFFYLILTVGALYLLGRLLITFFENR